jgi:hypothetical protein
MSIAIQEEVSQHDSTVIVGLIAFFPGYTINPSFGGPVHEPIQIDRTTLVDVVEHVMEISHEAT